MKICPYCGSETDNTSTFCPSCASNELKQKCDNCGSIIESGVFCSTCGVKVGQQVKKCPNCATEYYSNACPNCGHMSYNTRSAPVRIYSVPQPQPAAPVAKKSNKTWLWILGWLFLFPVPLTILVARSKKLETWAKVCIIVAAWLLYIIIGSTSEETSDTQQPEVTSDTSVSVSATSDIIAYTL